MTTTTAQSAESAAKTEQNGLRLSVIGSVGMAGLGFGFAAMTGSQAVLLDGVFSLVGFVVSLVALRVAAMVQRPGDDRFHFGYAAFEPMLNLIKGLLIGLVGLLAAWASVDSILSGGREIQGLAAVIYALIAAGGCLVIAAVQKRLSREVSSPLLEVDSRNWLMDGLISGTVAVGFCVVLILGRTPWAWMVPYADPVIVLLLVVFSLPIPITIIRANWGQLLGRAPEAEAQIIARELIDRALDGESGLESKIRILEQGRLVFLQVYVLVSAERSGMSVSDADRIRQLIADSIATMPQSIAYDIVFTTDMKWWEPGEG